MTMSPSPYWILGTISNPTNVACRMCCGQVLSTAGSWYALVGRDGTNTSFARKNVLTLHLPLLY